MRQSHSRLFTQPRAADIVPVRLGSGGGLLHGGSDVPQVLRRPEEGSPREGVRLGAHFAQRPAVEPASDLQALGRAHQVHRARLGCVPRFCQYLGRAGLARDWVAETDTRRTVSARVLLGSRPAKSDRAAASPSPVAMTAERR
jgi:hypothetical protein